MSRRKRSPKTSRVPSRIQIVVATPDFLDPSILLVRYTLLSGLLYLPRTLQSESKADKWELIVLVPWWGITNEQLVANPPKNGEITPLDEPRLLEVGEILFTIDDDM